MDDPRWEPGMPVLERQAVRSPSLPPSLRGLPPRSVPETRPTPLQRHYVMLSVIVLICGAVAITSLEFGAPLGSPVVKLCALIGAPLLALTARVARQDHVCFAGLRRRHAHVALTGHGVAQSRVARLHVFPAGAIGVALAQQIHLTRERPGGAGRARAVLGRRVAQRGVRTLLDLHETASVVRTALELGARTLVVVREASGAGAAGCPA